MDRHEPAWSMNYSPITRPMAVRLLTMGIVLAAIGIFALIAAFSATIATMVTMGLLLIAAGIAKIVEAAMMERGSHHRLSGLFVGIFYGVAGALVLARPGLAAVAVTVLLAALFFSLGIARILAASMVRYHRSGWTILSGVASVVLGIVVFVSWPVSAMWLVGTLLGVEFIFAGVELIGLSTTLPQVSPHLTREADTASKQPPPPPPEMRPPLS